MRNSPDTFPQVRQQHTIRRAGWTLIEMLLTVTVMSALTGVAVKTMGAMLRSERNGAEHVARLTGLSRLARQFRADVHDATSVELKSSEKPNLLLLLTLDDTHQIQYDVYPTGLQRTARSPNQPPKTEFWRLPQTQFQCVQSAEGSQMVTLVVTSSDPAVAKVKASAPVLQKELRFDAALGRNR